MCWRESSPMGKRSTHIKSSCLISLIFHVALQCSSPYFGSGTQKHPDDTFCSTTQDKHFLEIILDWNHLWKMFSDIGAIAASHKTWKYFVFCLILFHLFLFFKYSIHILICSQGVCSSLKVYGKTCLCQGFTHVHTLVILYGTYIQCCHHCQT